MLSILSKIKDDILNELSYYNNGFSGLYFDKSLNKFRNIDESNAEQVEGGINDSLGNYFIITSDYIPSFQEKKRITDTNKEIIGIANAKIISFIRSANPESIFDNLVRVILLKNKLFSIKSASINTNTTIQNEFGQIDKKHLQYILQNIQDYTVTSITFELRYNLHVPDTDLNICYSKICKKC